METLMFAIQHFLQDEEGASAVEYGVLVALIIVAVIVVIQQVGAQLNIAFARVKNCLTTPSTCT